MRLPFAPPLAPMLSSAADALPGGAGWQFEPKWDGFRTIVFRDGDEILLQSRDLKPLNRYFPELIAPLPATLPERCVVDGEIVIVGGARARLRRASALAPPSRRVAGRRLAARDAGLVRGVRSARRRRRGSARPAASASGAPAGAACWPALGPPVHLTPADARRCARGRLVSALRGRRARRRDRQAATARLSTPGKRAMLKVKHARTADCVVAGFRWHKAGRERARRVAAARPLRRRAARSITSG